MNTHKLIRSMSQKGCLPDHSVCEGFFGRLKNGMFCCCTREAVSTDEFVLYPDDCIKWYNAERITLSLEAKSPLQYRRDLGLVV